MVRGVGRAFAVIAAIGVVLFVITAVAISIRGVREDIFGADVVLVLGCDLHEDGTPTSRLITRLDRTVELYANGWGREIIVSGGESAGRDEALVMKDYLVSKGVPAYKIIVDSSGTHTRDAARFAARYLADRGLSSLIVVSQFFHIARCVMTIKSYGVGRVGCAYARSFEVRDILSTIREVPAVFAYSLGLR